MPIFPWLRFKHNPPPFFSETQELKIQQLIVNKGNY